MSFHQLKTIAPCIAKRGRIWKLPASLFAPSTAPNQNTVKVPRERGTFTLFWPLLATLVPDQWICVISPGACFSKVPKVFGPISDATIAFIATQCRGSRPSNFAILLVFLILKTCKKITFSKQADFSLTTRFSGPKSSRDFRETGPWREEREMRSTLALPMREPSRQPCSE